MSNYDIKDINQAEGGRRRMDWAEREMPVLRAGRLRCREDVIDAQIAVLRCPTADRHRLVAGEHMARAGVGLGIDGDGLHAKAARGRGDAAGDLAAVGNQDLLEHHWLPGARSPVRSARARRCDFVANGTGIRLSPRLAIRIFVNISDSVGRVAACARPP